MVNADLARNPLKNLNTMLKLNPYAKTARRMALLAEAQRVKAKKESLRRKGRKFPREINGAAKPNYSDAFVYEHIQHLKRFRDLYIAIEDTGRRVIIKVRADATHERLYEQWALL